MSVLSGLPHGFLSFASLSQDCSDAASLAAEKLQEIVMQSLQSQMEEENL